VRLGKNLLAVWSDMYGNLAPSLAEGSLGLMVHSFASEGCGSTCAWILGIIYRRRYGSRDTAPPRPDFYLFSSNAVSRNLHPLVVQWYYSLDPSEAVRHSSLHDVP